MARALEEVARGARGTNAMAHLNDVNDTLDDTLDVPCISLRSPAYSLDPDEEWVDDDAETLVAARTAELQALIAQPALPLPLVRRRAPAPAPAPASDDAWMASLPPESRAVLEAAARQLPPWPRSNRPSFAVLSPVRRIPSLTR